MLNVGDMEELGDDELNKPRDENDKVKHDAERVIVVDGKTYGFWLNEEDDVYEELYRKKEAGFSPNSARTL